MYGTMPSNHGQLQTIRTEMVEAFDSDSEEESKIAQWLELNNNECEANDIGIKNGRKSNKQNSVHVQTDAI